MTMKKWMIYLVLAYVVTGCKKETQPVRAALEEKPASQLAILLAKDVSSQRVMFNMLSNEQKHAVWQEHLEQKLRGLAEGSARWKLVHELIRMNNPLYYQARSDKKEVATTFMADSWLARAREVFPPEEIYEVAYSLNKASVDREYYDAQPKGNKMPDQLKYNAGSPYNNEALPDCFCAVGSSFTCPYTLVSYAPGGYSTGTLKYGTCIYNGTVPCDIEGGCGFVGWYLCDGNKCITETT